MIRRAERLELREEGTRFWGTGRRILGWIANIAARVALGLDAHYCTAGFRCSDWQVLESIPSEGYPLRGLFVPNRDAVSGTCARFSDQ